MKVTIDELRKIQLNILTIVDSFCEENNIKYVLAAGTLIGAIRHKGFIPWDDDIDIYMPRPDYERFLVEFNDYNSRYKAISIESDKKFLYQYAKISDQKTILIENVRNSYELGINIDVFPIDGIGNDDTKLLKKQILLRYMYDVKIIKFSKKRALIKNIILLAGKVILAGVSTQTIVKKMITNSKKYDYNEADKVCVLVEGLDNNKVYDKSVFSETITTQFEGSFFKIPKGYDEYLKGAYGDYMKLPPEKDRVTHHSFEVYYK